MGRPALQEEDKRIIQVNIRLTKEEHDTVCNYAQASAMTSAHWIRQKAFTGRFPAIKLSPVNAALYRELHKIGVNLNQAVRHVHGGKLSPAYLSILTSLMKTQKDILTVYSNDSRPGKRKRIQGLVKRHPAKGGSAIMKQSKDV
jgi:hypothetical protein